MKSETENLPKNLRAILFDLDGTLLDSFQAHFNAYAAMFARFNIKVNMDDLFKIYSPDWLQVYRAIGLPEENWETANQFWLEEAAKQVPELFPDVVNTLTQLKERFSLGLITSGTKSRVLRDLKRTKLLEFFDVIITGDDVQIPKPSPEGLLMALQVIGAAPQEAVYLGDTTVDYETARSAKMMFIGVTSPFATVSQNNGYMCIDSVNKFLDLLNTP